MIATVKKNKLPIFYELLLCKSLPKLQKSSNMALKVLSISIPFPEGFEITVWHKNPLQILFYGM